MYSSLVSEHEQCRNELFFGRRFVAACASDRGKSDAEIDQNSLVWLSFTKKKGPMEGGRRLVQGRPNNNES